MKTKRAYRALLLASASILGIAIGHAYAASVTVGSGQTDSTQDLLSGTDAVTVNSGGVYKLTSTTTSAIQWFGAATGGGISINNAGSILGATGSTQTLINANGVASTGTLTVINSGTMTNNGAVLGLGALPASANVIINNSGTITNTATTLSQVINGTPVTEGGIVSGAISEAATSTANMTITNSGTINGNIGLGAGTNVVNITTGSIITGQINGSSSSNNTINLSGSGSSFAYGATETVTPATGANPVAVFNGWTNIQTLNVNSGTWTLLGGGYYNTVNIASSAVFNVCVNGVTTACGSTYNGSQSPNATFNGAPVPGVGTITDGGIGPLNEVNGTLSIVNAGHLNVFNNSNNGIFYDPTTSPQELQVSGTGSLVFNGAGANYIAPGSSIIQASIELANGFTLIDAGTITSAAGATTIDVGSTLAIGSGGNLKNVNGNVVDNGTTGSVTGNIVDNGSLKFNLLSNFTIANTITGNGLITQAGTSALTLTGASGFTGSVLVSSGTLKSSTAFKLSGGDTVTVNSGGILQPSTSNSSAIQWFGAATGSGISINNAGTILGATGSGQNLISANGNSSTGTLTINNSGTITNAAGIIILGSLPASANVVINNSGTITETSTTSSGSFSINGTPTTYVENGLTLGAISASNLSAANETITNTGTINSSIALGAGTNVVNITTGSTITGQINGNSSSNNTINLSGTGSGFAFGQTETITPATGAAPVASLYGWNNIQTLNVNSGTWTLLGAGSYNTLTIAAGAKFITCDIPSYGTGCASGYSGAQSPIETFNGATILGTGTITDGGLSPLNQILNVVNNGALVVYTNDSRIYYDPTYNGYIQFSGTGSMQMNGTGAIYIAPVMSINQSTIEIANGFSIIDAGTVSATTLTIDAGGYLAIGSGGTLLNVNGNAPDNGKSGTVAGNIVNNGTLIYDRLDTSSYSNNISGSGALLQAGAGTLVLTGTNTYTGGTTISAGVLSVPSNPNTCCSSPSLTLGNTTATGTLQIGNGGTSGSITGNVTNNGVLALDRSDGTTLTGVISGTGSLVNILGTNILTGTNTYTGGTTISGGALQIGNGGTAGSIVGNIVDNGTLVISLANSYTVAGAFSGSGALIDNDPGVLTFSGAYSFTGTTTINGGGSVNVTQLQNNAPLTVSSGSTANISGTSSAGTVAVASGSTANLSGSSSATALNLASGGIANLSGSSSANSVAVANGSTANLSGTSSAATLTLASGGTANLSGTSSAGTVTVASGSTANLSGSSSASSLTLANGGTASLSGTPSVNALNVSSGGTVSVTGSSTTSTINSLTGTGGTVSVSSGSSLVVASGNFAGSITGSGSLTVAGTNTPLVLSGNDTVSNTNVSSGTLQVSGNLTSPVTVGNNASLGGSGTVSGAVTLGSGGVLAPGDPVTTNVVGTLTFQKGSIYLAQQTTTASDLTAVTGAAVIQSGAVVQTQQLGAATSYPRFSSFTILTATQGVTGTFSSVSSNVATISPYLSYSPNAVTLDLVRNDISLATLASTTNQNAVASAINSAGPSSAIYGLVAPNSDTVVQQSFNQLTGDIHASLRSAAVADSRIIRDTVLDHLGNSAGDTVVWGAGFGGMGSISTDGNASGLHHNSAGFIVGADMPLDGGFRLGLAGAYTSNGASTTGRASTASGNSGHVIGYGGWTDGNADLRFGGDYGWGNNQVTRNVTSFSQVDTDSQSQKAGQLFAEVGYKIKNANVTIEPYIDIANILATTGAFTETGGTTALSGAAKTSAQTYGTMGMRLALSGVTLGDDIGLLVPHIDLGLQHAFNSFQPGQTLTFQNLNQSFNVLGLPLSTDAAALRAGFDLVINPQATVSLDYDGSFGTREQNNAIRGSLSWKL